MTTSRIKVKSPKRWQGSRDHFRGRKLTGKPVSKKARKKRQRKKMYKRLFLVALLLGFLGFVVLAGAVAWFSRSLPGPDGIIERDIPQTTKIYDRTGETVLFEIHGDQKRTPIALEEIPDYVKWAAIVIEDKDFYKHGPISVRGMFRALVVNITRGDPTAQGGSTISQQFVRNALLTREKTYIRKIKEIVLAWRLERNFTKDEVLEFYFNEIPYGSVAYGIEAASQIYFGKSVRDISLAESAILAAMTQGPTYYSPYGSNVDELLARQQLVLNLLAKEGYVTQEEADQASLDSIKFEPPRGSITAPHFVLFVKELLADKYGENLVEQGGLKVITTLDLFKQERAEAAINENAERNETAYGATNAALVSLDPKTGQILAMVGSRDYFDTENDGNVNVTLRPRQPGSSVKPIVYATAFSLGLSPETVLWDVPTTFKVAPEDYSPRNYSDAYHGPVNIRKALAGSLNIPAVKTTYLIGVENVIDQAEKFGYTTFQDRSRFGLSITLGGGEVKLIEHVAAFGALAREGVKKPTTAILRVETPEGEILEEYEADKGEQVIEPGFARLVNDVLSDNTARAYVFGEQSYLTLSGRPVAAKTGSTNDFKDGWTLGYTPSLVTGVWVGNNDGRVMTGRASGGNVAGPIWNAYMRKVLGDTPYEEFKKPEKLELPDKPMLDGSYESGRIVLIDRASGKLATEHTPASFVVERAIGAPHSILQYITPGNILGPAPRNPGNDPNYETWEQGVLDWITENQPELLTGEAMPTLYDDLHVPRNFPSINILNPASGSTVTSSVLSASVSTTAPRGVSRVEYRLGGKLLQVARAAPFGLNASLAGIPNGNAVLEARAFDDIDNSKTDTIKLKIDLANSLPAPSIEWQRPGDGASISKAEFPYGIILQLGNIGGITKVDFYLEDSKGFSKWLGFQDDISDGRATLIWGDAPKAGTYQLTAVVSQGQTTTPLEGVSVTIN
jgi:membrane peptidoglycan carboxypeptidase